MRDPFISMALAYDGPLPGYEPRYQPTHYLTEEARLEREERLIARLAANPGDPDNQRVPASVKALVAARRELSEPKAA